VRYIEEVSIMSRLYVDSFMHIFKGNMKHGSQVYNYLCCEYQLIWTLNEWFPGGLVLAIQIQTHVHMRAVWHFSVYQSIDVHIIYICCEYQLIWAYDEWFIGVFVLIHQIEAHVHAHAGMHFLVY
jgi:hypothetical protein